MNYVIDCSFSSTLFLPDEKSGHARKFFLNRKPSDRVFIPALWWQETVNVLNVAVRRKRLNFNEVLKIIELFEKLPLETDVNHGVQYAKDLFELTRVYNLSSYDAAYVELAMRTKSRLMSMDVDILKAIKAIGL